MMHVLLAIGLHIEGKSIDVCQPKHGICEVFCGIKCSAEYVSSKPNSFASKKYYAIYEVYSKFSDKP